MRLLLIRHAESSANADGRLQGRLDFGLSDRGRRESAALAQRLSRARIDALYSSSLRRALETASILGNALGLDVTPRDALVERDMGGLSGLTRDEVRSRYPGYVEARMAGERYDIPGFESDESLFDRVTSCLAQIIASHRDQEVAVVSHGGAIGAFVRHVLNVPPVRPAGFALHNTSVTTLDVAEAAFDDQARPRIRVLSLNDVCHLADLNAVSPL